MSTEVILDIKKAPNKVTFGTTVITFITDPFNPVESKQVTTDLHGRTLDTYLKGYCLGANYLVRLNGKLFTDDFSSYIVQPNDNITYVSTIAGGGGGGSKQILGIVAMIALTVVSGGIAAGALAMAGGMFAAGSLSALILSSAVMMVGSLLINAVLAPDSGSSSAMASISSPELESKTYSWSGVQTSRDLNTSIPVLYGTHALGGTVINNRFYYNGTDDWLAVQLALCHGEIEQITSDNIQVQESNFSTFVGNPVGTDGYFSYTSGKFDQPIMQGFSDSVFNNGNATRQLSYNTTYSFTTESTNIDFFRLHFEFPRGLYHMDTQGNKSTRTVTISARYRKVGTATWSYLYTRVPNYRTEYLYSEVDSSGFSNTYWSTVYQAGSLNTRTVLEGYGTSASLSFSSSSSVAFKQYVEPTDGNGNTIILPIGSYEFEVVKTTVDDSDTDMYNVSETHVRYIEEINTADVNYGGVAMLGVNIKATDQLSSQRPSFTTTVTRKPLYLAGAYRDCTNPAWICYDILTNPHYGMGVNPTKLNFSEFNRWASFCNGNLNATYSINQPPILTGFANTYSNGIIIPASELPNGEVLTLNGLNKNSSVLSAIGTVLVDSVLVDTPLDINDIVKITYVKLTSGLGRPAGFYYYLEFSSPVKLGSIVSYTIVHNTKATIVNPKLSFNGVFDTTSDIWSTLQEVAKVGRGQVILQGTKYSCIYDAPKTVAGLYNAANSTNVVVSYLNRADIASELEIQYSDKNIGYEMTSISIQDADMMNSSVRSNKTSQTVKGITTEAEALVYGRYLLATSKYTRRVVTLDADIESITQSVGDLIAVQTDVTQYGRGGLIKSVIGPIVTLDDFVYLEVGKTYTLKIKQSSDDFIKDYEFVANISSPSQYLTFNSFTNTPVGVITFGDFELIVHEVNGNIITTNTLIVSANNDISKDDRYSFGLKGSDSILCIITDISREGDLTRKISAAEYNESILDFNYDNDILQRTNPTVRPKNALSNLKITDRLVKTDTTTVAMMSLSWSNTVSSYYNIYIMEDDFKNYLVMGVKGNRYEYAAVELTPELPYRIYIEDANDMGIFTYLDYTITAFSSPPGNISDFTVKAYSSSLEFNVVYPNEPLDFSHYEVYLEDNLISKQISSKFSIPAVLGKKSYEFKLIPIDMINKSGNPITKVINIDSPVINNVTYTQEKEYARFNLDVTSDAFSIEYYEFTSTGIIGTSKDSSILSLADWVGIKTFTFKVYDVMGNVSSTYSLDVNIIMTPPINLVGSIDGKDAILRWEASPSGVPIEYYEIEYDGNIYKSKSTQYRLPVYWNDNKEFKIRAVTTLGSTSSSVSTSIQVSTGSITSLKAEVIDNNVLLRWDFIAGTLPVETFMIYKGATELTLETVGEKKGTFTTIFENTSGTYTYWMAPVDSAGNIGSKLSVTTLVNQPPDYILNIDWYSTFTGTIVNGKLDNTVILPLNTTETITNHFTSRSWTTAQDQINAGYAIWSEPFGTSGSYTEVFDYGTVLSSSMVSVNLDKTIIKGAPSVSITISLSSDNISYTNYVGQEQVYGLGFRYVKVTINVTGVSSVVSLNSLNVRLDSKIITDSGRGVITTASTGVVVNFNKAFIDINSIQVTPTGTTPLFAVYDFVDIPNPTHFTVYLYDSSGTRVTGSFSWSARGY